MRVLVCGGRDYTDRDAVYKMLDHCRYMERGEVECVIEGGGTGADWFALRWASENNVHVKEFKADWARHGRAAGPMRNARMLAEGKPDLVIAFPGGRGTADMVRRARAAGVPVLEIAP